MTGRVALGFFTHVSGRALAVVALLSLLIAAPFSRQAFVNVGGGGSSASTGAAAQDGPWSLSPAARASISSALGADDSAYRVRLAPTGFQASNPAQYMGAAFERSRVLLSTHTLTLGIDLSAIGYGDARRELAAAAAVRAKQNRVTYSYAGLGEWYANGPFGVEQGFTIARAPAGRAGQQLTLAMSLSGNARVALAQGGQSAIARGSGGEELRYGGLRASDANGRALRTWLTLAGHTLLLHVQTTGASYPLKVDPLIEDRPEKELIGKEATAHGRFGMSVALSGDGATALVGAPWENGGEGGAWVFTRGANGWKQSGPELTIPAADAKAGDCGNETAEESEAEGENGSEGEESDECRFGRAVAVNGDGSMLVIGAPRADSDDGAVWLYKREETSTGTEWAQAAELANPAGSSSWFGRSVAVSASGETVLVGAPQWGGRTGGQAWVFTQTSSGWQPTGGPLIGQGAQNEGSFGRSVALSADGETALIGAPGIESTQGAAWVFTNSGSGWSGHGTRLLGGGGEAEHGFGSSVALSGDGATALVGAPRDQSDLGAAWVFADSGSGWSEQAMLSGQGQAGEELGAGVALSGDGTHALVGAPGALGSRGDALLFVGSGSSWGEASARLAGGGEESGSGQFGTAVALSEDAEAMLAGGRSEGKSGAAWVFGPYPSVYALSETSGPPSGGTVVEIVGEHIGSAKAVRFGARAAASFAFVERRADGREVLTTVSPPGMGTVDVTVETPIGISPTTPNDLFSYSTKTNKHHEGGGETGGPEPTPTPLPTSETPTSGAPGPSAPVGVSSTGVLAFGPVASSTCTVSLLSSRIAVQPHDLALFKLRGSGAARCAGKLKLTVRRKVSKRKYKTKVIGAASFSIAPGKSVAVKVKLNAAGRALLKAGHGRLGASLLLVKSSPTPAQAHTARVRLTRVKPHPKKKT